MTYANTGLKQYNAVGNETGVNGADSYRLIQMLFQGALDRISAAKGSMQRGEVSKKGEQISKAISIIDGLRVNLDKDKGGEIAKNLESLYDYFSQRLLQANMNDEPAALDEVHAMLVMLKGAWDAIPQESAVTANDNAAGKSV